jgi:hypothetical protein
LVDPSDIHLRLLKSVETFVKRDEDCKMNFKRDLISPAWNKHMKSIFDTVVLHGQEIKELMFLFKAETKLLKFLRIKYPFFHQNSFKPEYIELTSPKPQKTEKPISPFFSLGWRFSSESPSQMSVSLVRYPDGFIILNDVMHLDSMSSYWVNKLLPVLKDNNMYLGNREQTPKLLLFSTRLTKHWWGEYWKDTLKEKGIQHITISKSAITEDFIARKVLFINKCHQKNIASKY